MGAGQLLRVVALFHPQRARGARTLREGLLKARAPFAPRGWACQP